MPARILEKNDELLGGFLKADSEGVEDAALNQLLECARPIIYNVLKRKSALLGAESDLAEELNSRVVMRLLEQLRRCKDSYLEGDDVVIVQHFPPYCQMLTTNLVNEYLRLKYPRRASLQNQLLYLIREAKDEGNRPLFALWRDIEERLSGFHVWEGRKFAFTERHQLLNENVGDAKHQALGAEDAPHLPLVRVLDSFFRWVSAPTYFDSVVGVIAHWRGIEDRSSISLSQTSDEEGPSFELVSPSLSPEEQTVLNEYLCGLWQTITQLPPKQRVALLLNLCDPQGRGVLGLLPILGIASLHEIAETLQMSVHEFAAIWPKLPLSDREIAQLYNCDVAVVPMWRSRARTRLKKDLEEA